MKIADATGEENTYTINFSQSSVGEATTTVIDTNDISLDIFPKDGTYKNTYTNATSFEKILKLTGELIVLRLAFRDLAQWRRRLESKVDFF